MRACKVVVLVLVLVELQPLLSKAGHDEFRDATGRLDGWSTSFEETVEKPTMSSRKRVDESSNLKTDNGPALDAASDTQRSVESGEIEENTETVRNVNESFVNQKTGRVDWSVPPDKVEVIFVRHGQSLNNLFLDNPIKNALAAKSYSPDKTVKFNTSFMSSYAEICKPPGWRVPNTVCGPYPMAGVDPLGWELSSNSRDGLLSPQGLRDAARLRTILLDILKMPPGAIQGFYASPLRRTIQTLFEVFYPWIAVQPDAKVGLQPWAHECFKTLSDLAYPASISAKFVQRYERTRFTGEQPAPLVEAFRKITRQLGFEIRDGVFFERAGLGDWPVNVGAISPAKQMEVDKSRGHAVTDVIPSFDDVKSYPASLVESLGDALHPFYPKAEQFSIGAIGSGGYTESGRQLGDRMEILKHWLAVLPAGQRHVLVVHGGVLTKLFGGKFENLAVVVAQFDHGVYDPKYEFFTKTDMAKDVFHSEIPGRKGAETGSDDALRRQAATRRL